MHHAFAPSLLEQTPGTHQQEGFVLVVGMIVLLVLTLLGVTAMRGTTLQTAMAGNMQDRAIALQAAEAALRAGENRLDQATLPVFDVDAGYYTLDPADDRDEPRWQSFYGPGGNAADNVVAYPDDLGAAEASFFVEQLQEIVLPGNSLGSNAGGSSYVYRVFAQGTGRDPNTVVVLESTVIR